MVGSTEPASVRAEVKRLLVELVKAALVSDPNLLARSRQNGRDAHARISARSLERADLGIELDPLWIRAVEEAERDPAVRSAEDVNPTMPMTCPVDLAALLSARFDFDALARIIRESASFG